MNIPGPIRYSTLKHMAASPAHFYAAWNGEQVGQYNRNAMNRGSAVHSLVLGGAPVLRYEGTRRGKEWEAYKADNAGSWILSSGEYEKANRMADAVNRHREAREVLVGPGITNERETFWYNGQLQCKGTPDAYTFDRVADLKTCATAHPDKFKWQAARLGYHAQLSWYSCGIAIAHKLSTPPRSQYIVAVESTPPHPVVVYELTPADRGAAYSLWNGWLEKVRECMDRNEWPGYAQGIVPLDVPTNDVALNWDEEEAA